MTLLELDNTQNASATTPWASKENFYCFFEKQAVFDRNFNIIICLKSYIAFISCQ